MPWGRWSSRTSYLLAWLTFAVGVACYCVFGIGGQIYYTMYVEGSANGYSRLFQHYGTSAQANPPVLTALPTNTVDSTIPSTPSGPPRAGYLTALQGVSP